MSRASSVMPERRAAAIQDLPARRRELERAHALVQPERLERPVVPDLQDGQPCRDAAERQQDDREQRDEAPSAPSPHGASGERRPNPGTRRMTTSSGATMWYRSAHDAILLGDDSRAAVVASTSCCSDSSVTRDCREWTANAVCANSAFDGHDPDHERDDHDARRTPGTSGGARGAPADAGGRLDRSAGAPRASAREARARPVRRSGTRPAPNRGRGRTDRATGRVPARAPVRPRPRARGRSRGLLHALGGAELGAAGAGVRRDLGLETAAGASS